MIRLFFLIVSLGATLAAGGCTLPFAKTAERQAIKLPQGQSAMMLGMKYERSGNDRLARQFYLEALEQESDPWLVHHRLGAVSDRLGMFQESEKHYQRALERMANSADLHNDLGYSYYLSGRLEEAERELGRCIRLEPEHRRAHNNLGMVLACLGRSEESLAEFRQAGATENQAIASLAFATLEGHRPRIIDPVEKITRLSPDPWAHQVAKREVRDFRPSEPRSGPTVRLLEHLEVIE